VGARPRLAVALAGAVAASAGDLGLVWVGLAHDGAFGLPAPWPGMLLLGHYLGVLGIPLYGLGYAALAAGIRGGSPRAARAVCLLGAVGAVVGAVVHGLTGALTHAAIRTGASTAPSAMLAIPEAAFLLPLWGIVALALAAGSLAFAAAVGRGGTRYPRWMAFCNPLAATGVIAGLAAPLPLLAALVVPAAPNLAHVVVFTVALVAADRHPSPRG